MHLPQQAPAPATTPKSANAELTDQIKQSIDATNAAVREATQTARNAGQAAREARQAAVSSQPIVAPIPPVPTSGAFTVQNGGGFGADSIPPQVVDISLAFFATCAFIVVGWPIARALGRRLERRADAPVVTAAASEQLQRIEQAVEAMAIEIERISESQRFVAKLQSGRAPDLAAHPAERR